MKQNPIATIIFSNGGKVQMELYPDIAPNAVASFIYLAKQGVYDHYPIERIVPGWVLDMSYHAFHNPKACYFIPNDVKSGKYLEAVPGTIGLGGYGAPEIAGGEFFFPLADCPSITGVYPIFGKITDGMEQIRWMEQLETYSVPYPDAPDVKINTPVRPVFIEKVQIETFGRDYGEPIRLEGMEKPLFWPCIYP